LREFDYDLYGEYFRYSNFAALSPRTREQLKGEIRGRW
jgi:hypothetical protein